MNEILTPKINRKDLGKERVEYLGKTPGSPSLLHPFLKRKLTVTVGTDRGHERRPKLSTNFCSDKEHLRPLQSGFCSKEYLLSYRLNMIQ